MGMGMDGRAAALAAYFQLIRADLRVACKLLTPRVGLPSESLASFMGTGAKPAAAAGGGAARVLVAQVLLVPGSGSAHAIAVHAAAFDGKCLVLRTHDQLFQERGKHTVRCGAQSKRKGFALPSCPWQDGSQTHCDGIVKITLHGLVSCAL